MLLPIKDWGKGLNLDVLPSELEAGYCSTAINFRFRNGFAEVIGGTAAVFQTPLVVPYWIDTYASTTTRFLIKAGIAKVYCDDGTTQTEITRRLPTVAITTVVYNGGAGVIATVTTTTPHGLATANSVEMFGFAPNAYNGTFSITVTGVSTFTYTMGSSPGVNPTTTGYYEVLSGTGNFTGAIDDRWSGGFLNGVQLLNNPLDGLYYWGGDVATKLRPFRAVAPIKADVARPFKAYIVLLGSTVAGVKKPFNVKWSNAAEPGTLPTTFVAADTNDSGEVDLAATPGFVVDCLDFGNDNHVYKQDARYLMRLVGGDAIFDFIKVEDVGLLNRGCVTNTPKGQVFLSQDKDVRIHQGGMSRSIAEGRIRQYLIDNMTGSTEGRSFLVTNESKSEVWVCLTTLRVIFIWNWDSDTWGEADFNPFTCGCSGLVPTSIDTASEPRLLIAHSDPLGTGPLVGMVDSGTTYFGVSVSATMSRSGLHFDDEDSMKFLQRSRWQIDGNSNAVSIFHGSSKTADGAVTYTSPVTYTVGTTNFADKRATAGRYLAVKLIASTCGLRVRSCQLDVSKGGTR